MKGFYVAAVFLSALSTWCQAADEASMHGSIRFTGAVVGSNCTLTSRLEGRIFESCPLDTVSRTLSVQTPANEPIAQIHVSSLTQASPRDNLEYVLVNATGHLVTQGRYVITLTVL